MNQADGVRTGTVALVAGGSTLACWVLLTLWRNARHGTPQVPWLGLVPLLLLTVGVLVAGWTVRRYVRTAEPGVAGRRRVSPQRARGTLVAAQAAALGGGALLGWYAANALIHVPYLDVPSLRALMVRAAVSAAAALLLTVAGLVAQSWCRIPPAGEDGDSAEPDNGSLAFG